MNEKSNNQPIDPELEARLVAFVLGEASDFEREQLTRLIDQRPELAVFVQQIRGVDGLLHDVGSHEVVAEDDDWKLSAEKRSVVLSAISGETFQQPKKSVLSLTAAQQSRWKRRSVRKYAAAAVVMCVVGAGGGIATLGYLGMQQASRASYSVATADSASAEYDYVDAAVEFAMEDAEMLGGGGGGGSGSGRFYESATPAARDSRSPGSRFLGSRVDSNGQAKVRAVQPIDAGSALSGIRDTLGFKQEQPSPYYLEEDVQYIPSGREFGTPQNEIAPLQQRLAEQESDAWYSKSSEGRESQQASTVSEQIAQVPQLNQLFSGNQLFRGQSSGRQSGRDAVQSSRGLIQLSVPEVADSGTVRMRLDSASKSRPATESPDVAMRFAKPNQPSSGRVDGTVVGDFGVAQPSDHFGDERWGIEAKGMVESESLGRIAQKAKKSVPRYSIPSTGSAKFDQKSKWESAAGASVPEGLMDGPAQSFSLQTPELRGGTTLNYSIETRDEAGLVDEDVASVATGGVVALEFAHQAGDQIAMDFDSGVDRGLGMGDADGLEGASGGGMGGGGAAGAAFGGYEMSADAGDLANSPKRRIVDSMMTQIEAHRGRVAADKSAMKKSLAVKTAVPLEPSSGNTNGGQQSNLGSELPADALGLIQSAPISTGDQRDYASKGKKIERRFEDQQQFGYAGQAIEGFGVESRVDPNPPVPNLMLGVTPRIIIDEEEEPAMAGFAVDGEALGDRTLSVDLERETANVDGGWRYRARVKESLAEISELSDLTKIRGADNDGDGLDDSVWLDGRQGLTRNSSRSTSMFFDTELESKDQQATYGENRWDDYVPPTAEKKIRVIGKPVKKAAAPAGLNEIAAADEAFSTFSLHVSDVSFKLAMAALSDNKWPEAAKVRIEEFVNAFDYGDPMPSQDAKVACRIEQSVHPFLQQRNMMRVSMRTAAAGRASQTPLRLTLLLDNSGSMERSDRQQTVRRAFALLAGQLKPIDQVTLISFARQPRLLADKVSGADSERLVGLVDNLPSEGGTNIEAALKLAFEKAQEQQTDDAQNRIILLTDGAVNLGDAKPDSLSRVITGMREAGIAFDAAGISAAGLNDEVLEALTRQGDGRYYLLDSMDAADDGFAQQIAGALRPSAKNVKVQIEFNPDRVGSYKLLGFEKHLLKKEDFRNDAVDAAEMAAAEAGVAVYQFEAKPDGTGDVGSVSVRFRDLSSGQMVEHRWPIPYESNAPRPDQAAPSLRLAMSAALLAAKLRGDSLGETVDLKTLSNLIAGLPQPERHSERVKQLKQMIEQARQLGGSAVPAP